jgi:hypothetical protein
MNKQNKKEISNNKSTMTEKQTGQLSMFLFTLTACIYFANAWYSYYKNIEGGVSINIALGIMFFCIGLSFLSIKSK